MSRSCKYRAWAQNHCSRCLQKGGELSTDWYCREGVSYIINHATRRDCDDLHFYKWEDRGSGDINNFSRTIQLRVVKVQIWPGLSRHQNVSLFSTDFEFHEQKELGNASWTTWVWVYGSIFSVSSLPSSCSWGGKTYQVGKIGHPVCGAISEMAISLGLFGDSG